LFDFLERYFGCETEAPVIVCAIANFLTLTMGYSGFLTVEMIFALLLVFLC
jgi:hypothetical protein